MMGQKYQNSLTPRVRTGDKISAKKQAYTQQLLLIKIIMISGTGMRRTLQNYYSGQINLN